MSVRITWINKAGGDHEDPHVAISWLGWTEDGTNKTGKTSRVDMHKWVKDGGQAYVRDALGVAYLVAKTSRFGNPFVQTVADGRPTDNLLHLPECP